LIDGERLREVLGSPHLAWLVERLRRRLARGTPLTGTVSLKRPSAEERRAVEALLGRTPGDGESLSVSLEALEQVLRHAEICADLTTAIESLCGPQVDQRALRRRREEAWGELWRLAEAKIERPEISAWLKERRTYLLLRRYSGRDPEKGRNLLDQVLEVIARLPARGVPLAQLAAEVAGDSHALDSGRPLGNLAITAAAALGGESEWQSAEARRRAWAAVGVLTDGVSASVLVHGLLAAGDSLTGEVLNLHRRAGEPCRLTIRQLLRHPPRFENPGTIYLCENPTVLTAAADRHGAACAPILCLEGQPNLAAHTLLQRLRAAGARFLIHGDFDWTGLRIAGQIMERHGAFPWRFCAEDFRRAGPGAGPLKGRRCGAKWDPELTPAMVAAGFAVHEEQVLEELLGDLGLSSR
jgi:uncharacterized protein (TIGR02679 family)